MKSFGVALFLLPPGDQILHRSHKPRPDSPGFCDCGGGFGRLERNGRSTKTQGQEAQPTPRRPRTPASAPTERTSSKLLQRHPGTDLVRTAPRNGSRPPPSPPLTRSPTRKQQKEDGERKQQKEERKMTKNGEPLGRDSNFLRKVLKVKGCGVGAVPFTSLGIALDLLMHCIAIGFVCGLNETQVRQNWTTTTAKTVGGASSSKAQVESVGGASSSAA